MYNYSRQNLLSTNSAKSNEEQQMQQQQQETQFERPTSMPHQQQQQQQPPSYNFHQQNLDECSNNLNYAANNNTSNSAQNKYLRIIQRSRINQQNQQQQYQQNIYQQQRDFLQQLNWLEEHENAANNTNNSNTASNTADMMYHNYNIQQSNKVGPKPNWRFRNLNEEYNTHTAQQQQNSRHTAQPLQRYQNTLTFQQQQQQQQHQRLQHFLNLPQQHQQTTTTHTQSTNQDFLLRTAVEIDVGGEANYNFLNTQQQLPLDFSNPQQHNNDNMLLNGNENNEEDDEEEEDDTTSEEIKRNLLVNALKNDKFTTKFYESIKEDVFRRLESMLLDKDNINSETTVSNAGQQNLHFNNISNISLRKLNLNEQRDQLLQQQQLQHNQQFQSQLMEAATQNSNEESHNSVAGIINNEYEQPLSSSNNDNDNENENEKPEEDANWRQSVINNCNNSNQTTQISNNNTNTTNSSTVNATVVTKNITKKRKNLRKQCTNQTNVNASNTNEINEEDAGDNLKGACSLAAQQHQKLQQETKDKQNDNKNETNVSSTTNSPKSTTSSTISATKQHHSTENDLIKYIINRIRNQTHTNTLINDALLVDVAKLTATVAQNAQPLTHKINLGSNTNNISPKKIYAKIKKLSLPKERDEFLRWYQKYLENTLFGHQRQPQHSSDKGKSSIKTANNQQQEQQQQRQNDLQPAATDDGDLAEADQNCSLNNSGGSCSLTNNKNADAPYLQTFSENNIQTSTLMLMKTESSNSTIECENNENPDEAFSLSVEDNRESSLSNSSETTNDKTKSENILQTFINLKANESLKATTNEKSDLKCVKSESVEKE